MDAIQQKHLGAFYTDDLVAEYLVRWAIRDNTDRILDPSCGDGVFLNAAIRLLAGSKQTVRSNVFGVDVQEDVISGLSQLPVPIENLIVQDFFILEPGDIPQFDVIVGNPPYIRYQTFNGATREKALKACRLAGVYLPQLTSSWAAFLVHSTRFLKRGGRLAMVIPAEINHASYALPVLQYLINQFRNIQLVAFREPLFPTLNQDTFCLLADGLGEKCKRFSLVVCQNAKSLRSLNLDYSTDVDINSIFQGKHRIIEYLIPEGARILYHDLAQTENIHRLGDLADVGIGYVTGNNEYFHVSSNEVEFYDIHRKYLKPAIRSGKQLRGLMFTENDWREADDGKNKVWLLHLPPNPQEIPESVARYLRFGINQGVANSYKCRVRKPWYSVPHVYLGDGFLSYMSGTNARLVANDAKVVATNSLHVIKLHPLVNVQPRVLSALWYTTLTMMSCEIQGHALGGGMLKLEPSEAEKVLLVFPHQPPDSIEINRLDSILRTSENGKALDYTDNFILKKKMGLTEKDCSALRDGYEQLKYWRMR